MCHKIALSVLALCMYFLTSCNGDTKRVRGFSCGNCPSPKFQGKLFYLPFCSEDEDGNKETHHSICDAICKNTFKKGSCDGCESKCTPLFSPVCSTDQSKLFANACHAKCAGLKEEGVDFVDCEGINTVIPGKTKLPPNRVPPKKLQVTEDEAQEGDDDV